MKKLIVILFLLSAICSRAQNIAVVYPGYVSYYNPATLIPDSVISYVKVVNNPVDRYSGKFFATDGRPNLTKDYKGSKEDIGHNSSADDNKQNKKREKQSFDWVNTFPQKKNNNRIVWLGIETYTRSLAAKYDSVRVKVSWFGISYKMGKDSVVVPACDVKELWYHGNYEKFVVPNQDTVSLHHYTYYRVK